MRKKEIQKREERAGEISWEGERGERERERGRERLICSPLTPSGNGVLLGEACEES